ncbi:MAG: hypothetical protein H7122_00425 [Chitinophagaceae bacterium]|nr:hypothetical protein [Chitinophagaceae bacterium]
MKKTNLFAIGLLFIFSFTCFDIYSQSADDLKGRWEGVHYYGDTTRLYDGTLIVRASTIDSMKMILTIEQSQEGKFSGKLHEHFYSDPSGSYFNADVSGFIKNEKIHFTSFQIKERRMPEGNKWCKPTATGVLIKNENFFFLQMWFESSLTCTIGPAILQKRISENTTKAPIELQQPKPQEKIATTQKSESPPPAIKQKSDSSFIIENFRRRNRSGNSTIIVQSGSIKINFVDNGTVDGDSISVFINGRLEAAHVRLTTTAFTMNVQFESGIDEIEVAMFAENLGSLPPNTALMQIVDGKKVHQAYLSSDATSNAVIKIKKGK